jgi:hypothetical protein
MCLDILGEIREDVTSGAPPKRPDNYERLNYSNCRECVDAVMHMPFTTWKTFSRCQWLILEDDAIPASHALYKHLGTFSQIHDLGEPIISVWKHEQMRLLHLANRTSYHVLQPMVVTMQKLCFAWRV